MRIKTVDENGKMVWRELTEIVTEVKAGEDVKTAVELVEEKEE